MFTLSIAIRTRLNALLLGLLLHVPASAGLVYTVNRTVGDTGSVVGTIETDGTLGVLTATNIVDWSLTISDGQFDTFLLDGYNNSGLLVFGDFFTATGAGLFFDFSSDDSKVLFQSPDIGSAQDWWCLESQAGGCSYWAAAETVARTPATAQRTTTHQGVVQIASIQGGGQVPEPATLPMVAAAGLAALSLRRKRQ